MSALLGWMVFVGMVDVTMDPWVAIEHADLIVLATVRADVVAKEPSPEFRELSPETWQFSRTVTQGLDQFGDEADIRAMTPKSGPRPISTPRSRESGWRARCFGGHAPPPGRPPCLVASCRSPSPCSWPAASTPSSI